MTRSGFSLGADADGQRGDGEVTREVGDGGDLAVGHDVERAVAVAQLGHAQGQVLDGALQAGDLDVVADGVLIFEQDEEAGEHVLEERLRAEADAQADDAGAGDERAQRDAQGAECLHEDIESR